MGKFRYATNVQLPSDFHITEDHEKYCEERGYPKPAVFLEEFLDHFNSKLVRWRDWDLVFKRWINRSSPSGRFYDARHWESLLAQSKQQRQKKEASLVRQLVESPPNETLDQARDRQSRGLMQLRAARAQL